MGSVNRKQGDVLVTNLRHCQGLQQTDESLTRVLAGMDSGITGDPRDGYPSSTALLRRDHRASNHR